MTGAPRDGERFAPADDQARDGEMVAVVADRIGPPEVLLPRRLPVPTVADGEVLVRVRSCGVNPIDWKSRAGNGVGLSSFPVVLGWDVCGTVVATTPAAAGVEVGAEVYGMLRFPALAGGYAEYVAAPAGEIAPVPAGVGPDTAAAAPMSAVTAWQSLVRHGDLQPGQRVLVHGAAGGVGHLAVQIAKLSGAAEVTGTGSAASRDFVLGLGADELVDYRAQPLEKAASDIDVVLDTRGGQDALRLLEVLRPGGVLVSLLGDDATLTAAARAKGVRVGYTYVSPDPEALAAVTGMLADGGLEPAVQEVFPLAEAAAAHAVGDAGHVRGRLVLATG